MFEIFFFSDICTRHGTSSKNVDLNICAQIISLNLKALGYLFVIIVPSSGGYEYSSWMTWDCNTNMNNLVKCFVKQNVKFCQTPSEH